MWIRKGPDIPNPYGCPPRDDNTGFDLVLAENVFNLLFNFHVYFFNNSLIHSS